MTDESTVSLLRSLIDALVRSQYSSSNSPVDESQPDPDQRSELISRINEAVSELIELYRDMEHRLREAEEKAARTRRLARVGDWSWDVASGEVRWSSEIYGFFGLTPEEFEPEIDAVMSMFYGDDKNLDQEILHRASEKADTTTFESRIVHTNGEIRYLYSTTEGRYDENGELVRLVGTVQDITESKRAGEMLVRERSLLNNIIDQNPYAIWISDKHGTLMRINHACCLMLGINAEDVINVYNIHNDEIVKTQGFMPLVERVFSHAQTARFLLEYDTAKIPFQTSLSSRIYLDVTIAPVLDAHGELTNTVVIHRDVTETRLVQQELQRERDYAEYLIESANAMIIVIDAVAKTKVFNQAAVQITGYSKDDVRDVNLVDLIVPEKSRDEAWNAFRRSFHEGATRGAELPIVTKTGQERYISWRSTRLSDDESDPSLLLFGIDISEQKELEARLLHAQKLDAVGQLAGGIAHDFNNMLGVILGHTELMKWENLHNGKLVESIEQIEKAAVRSRNITRQLLAFSRKQIISPRTVSANRQVSDLKRTILQLIGEDIDLHFRPASSPCNIFIDPTQFDQVVMNLALNARDAMAGGGDLTLEIDTCDLEEAYCAVHPEASPGEYVRLSVSDSGIGMEREILEHIFEPFFTTKEQGKGTGLGLATVYGVVKQSGGFISTYSEPGHGTTFNVYLPRDAKQPEASERSGNMDELPVSVPSARILLVEDEEMVRHLACEMLTKLGYRVISARNPTEAMEHLSAGTDIDLVITDVIMPGMNGQELYGVLRESHPGIRVLFVSGYTSHAIVRHGILDEGVHFLEKPFGINELARKVHETLMDEQ